MQFKRQKHRIQVIAYAGYDKEKRRPILKMLGSLNAYSYTPSKDLLNNINSLEDEEKREKYNAELQEYIKKQRHKNEMHSKQIEMDNLYRSISRVADTINSGEFEPDEKWAAGLWAAVDDLGKAMRRAGFPKSHFKGAAAKKKKTGDKQSPLPLGKGGEAS